MLTMAEEVKGQTSCKQTLRQYKELPVWVVEDHNDALEPIYRAIASRHLPFSGVAMLHFDSHPDLQIATDMDADTVFNKSDLINSLSIENWIMPALYAGHLHHVIWVKPPWADQLPEGRQIVKIGKHKNTGKLRVTWPDVYFLSDVLYAPCDKLENYKSVTIDTVTMETDILKLASFQGSMSKSPGITSDNFGTDSKRTKMNDGGVVSKNRNNVISEQRTLKHFVVVDETPVDETSVDEIGTSKGQQQEKSLSTELKDTRTKTQEGDDVMKSDVTGHLEVMPGHLDVTSGQLEVTPGHSEVITKAIDTGKPYVLDIDLDFFSTKNPFREVYTKDQFELLEDLYSFTPPTDESVDALEQCQQGRAVQLKELQSVIQTVWDGAEMECVVEENRLVKVQSLVTSLRRNPPKDDTLDAELIHMAGLTCDDTGELPHHVSTVQEIHSLVEAAKTLLSRLPKPTIVTIARSSHDDYCPPDQVDDIQMKVLQMLESVYGHCDVHLSYDDHEESM